MSERDRYLLDCQMLAIRKLDCISRRQINTRNPLEVPSLPAIEVEELRQHHQDMDQDLYLKAFQNQQPILPNWDPTWASSISILNYLQLYNIVFQCINQHLDQRFQKEAWKISFFMAFGGWEALEKFSFERVR